MTETLVHIGFHKTGTTWLQRGLFQPEHGYRPILSHREVFDTFLKPHALAFDPSQAARIVDAARAEVTDHVPVISSENLSGNPMFGGRESAEFARRLHHALPDARILITVREQIRTMASQYMQYLRSGGTDPYDVFFSEDPEIGYTGFDTTHYEYHRLVAYYRELFGADRVLVLTQELMGSDPAAFIARLGQFSGAIPRGVVAIGRVNRNYPQIAAPLFRRINHIRKGPVKPEPVLTFGFGSEWLYRRTGWAVSRFADLTGAHGKRPVTRFLEGRYPGRFADSNRALLTMMPDGVSLAGYQGAEE